jgi:hypothetical protein
MWSGCPLAKGCTLEWRIIFLGSSAQEPLFEVNRGTILIPVPGEHEQLEVDVILAPPGFMGSRPHNDKLPTRLLAEGSLVGGYHVWLLYTTAPSAEPETKENRVIEGTGHRASDAGVGEARGIGAGRQADGSLAFWDMRAEILEDRAILRP